MITITKSTTTRYEIILSFDELRQIINGDLARPMAQIPRNARIYMKIPGGADWSNTDLDMGEGYPLIIEWEEKTDD